MNVHLFQVHILLIYQKLLIIYKNDIITKYKDILIFKFYQIGKTIQNKIIFLKISMDYIFFNKK